MQALIRTSVRLGILGLVIAHGAQCAVVQSVRDPVEKLLRRGACISVDIPPITLTPERTAAERQLIGTEGEIEEDGWLIASAQSASATAEIRESGAAPVTGTSEFRSQNRRYRIESEVIEFYYPLVLKYRRAELLGEGYDGRLRVVPTSLSRARFSEESDTAVEVAGEVNRARLWIADFLRSADASAADRAASRNYIPRWYTEARSLSGEWIYTERRKWERAR